MSQRVACHLGEGSLHVDVILGRGLKVRHAPFRLCPCFSLLLGYLHTARGTQACHTVETSAKDNSPCGPATPSQHAGARKHAGMQALSSCGQATPSQHAVLLRPLPRMAALAVKQRPASMQAFSSGSQATPSKYAVLLRPLPRMAALAVKLRPASMQRPTSICTQAFSSCGPARPSKTCCEAKQNLKCRQALDRPALNLLSVNNSTRPEPASSL
eukprot:1145675-Pelagomonas_calceolata.AAC.3